MEIWRLLHSVTRKWWLIVLLAVLGGGIGFLNYYHTVPMYQANTKLYIMNFNKVKAEGKSLSSSDLTLSQELVRQYFDIIYSRSVTSAVSKEVKEYNLSENAILSMISMTSKLDSNVFTISARGDDPIIAAAVANATGRVFSSQIRQLSNSDNVGVLDEALVPRYPLPDNGTSKILLGVLMGLIIALGIIYIIEYFDTTVRSAEDIVRGLKVRVIGIIPEHDIR